MKVYAIVLMDPERVYKTYRTLGAAKGARTQMGWQDKAKIVVFTEYGEVA